MPSAQYIAVQVTLTDADTNYNLLALLQALVTDCPATCRELTIQAAADNTAKILIGDSNMSGTRFGLELSPADSRTYRSGIQNVLVGLRYARSASAGQKLNIEIDLS